MLFGLRATLSVSHWGRNSASGTSFQFTSSACVPRPKRFHRVARACVHTFLSIVVRLASVCGFSISWALVRQTRAELSVAFVALCCQGFCTDPKRSRRSQVFAEGPAECIGFGFQCCFSAQAGSAKACPARCYPSLAVNLSGPNAVLSLSISLIGL